MTRYYFHAENGTKLRDEDGEELSSLEAAKTVASSVMAELLSLRHDQVWDDGSLCVTVNDEEGRLVARLTTVATSDSDGFQA